jgi:hypothetical protein
MRIWHLAGLAVACLLAAVTVEAWSGESVDEEGAFRAAPGPRSELAATCPFDVRDFRTVRGRTPGVTREAARESRRAGSRSKRFASAASDRLPGSRMHSLGPFPSDPK